MSKDGSEDNNDNNENVTQFNVAGDTLQVTMDPEQTEATQRRYHDALVDAIDLSAVTMSDEQLQAVRTQLLDLSMAVTYQCKMDVGVCIANILSDRDANGLAMVPTSAVVTAVVSGMIQSAVMVLVSCHFLDDTTERLNALLDKLVAVGRPVAELYHSQLGPAIREKAAANTNARRKNAN